MITFLLMIAAIYLIKLQRDINKYEREQREEAKQQKRKFVIRLVEKWDWQQEQQELKKKKQTQAK